MHVDVHRAGLMDRGDDLVRPQHRNQRARLAGIKPADRRIERRQLGPCRVEQPLLARHRIDQDAAWGEDRMRGEPAGVLFVKAAAGARKDADRKVAVGLAKQRRRSSGAVIAGLVLAFEEDDLGRFREVRSRRGAGHPGADDEDVRGLRHASSVEPGAVALGGVALGGLDRAFADLLGDDAPERGEIRLRDVLLRVPQIGADQRLAAVEIDLVGGDQDAAARHLAVDRAGFEQCRVRGDASAPVHPQRLAQPGHEKDQPDARGGQEIADRVDPVIAEPVGDQQRLVVEHLDKARRVALGRGVDAARRVGRGDHQKRRQRDERARVLFQPRQLLFDRALGRLAVDRTDLRDVLDDLHPRLLSPTAPTMHERRVKLQAEIRAMGVVVVREDRPEGGHVARLTIDNAAKLNTLNRALMVELVEAIERLEADAALRLVILRGADISELAALDQDSARDFITLVHRCCDGFRRLAVPVIARIDGYALGAGLELAAACDLRVASERAIFGMPEVRIGIPSVVEAALLPLLIGHGRARRLLLTGETIGAAEALAWGLIDAVVPPAELDAAVERFAAAILAGGPQAIRRQKALILEWEELSTSAAVARGIDALAEAYATDEPRRMAEARLAEMRARRRAEPR